VPHFSRLGPSRLHTFGEGPWRHEVFHHGTVLELVLNRVWVVRTSHYEKFLKMIFWRPHLTLEVMFSSRYAHLARDIGFLVTVTIACYYGDTSDLPILPFPTAVVAFPGTHNGGLGGCGSATISGRFCIT
jgi:hypothetical protein